MNAPPDYVIEEARKAALKSPCQKSKRGVAVFNPEEAERRRPHMHQHSGNIIVAGVGFNGPPLGFRCDGSVECRRDCAKFCLHAEHRAIRAAGILDDVGDLELVHVKVIGEHVVPGGPPSCWQCSREVVDVGLRGVWLFEVIDGDVTGHDLRDVGVWRYYTAYSFHVATLKNCGLRS